MRRRVAAALLVLGATLFASGCQSVFTSIRQESPGTYVLTEARQGFLRMHGAALRCTAEGTRMRCTEIAKE